MRTMLLDRSNRQHRHQTRGIDRGKVSGGPIGPEMGGNFHDALHLNGERPLELQILVAHRTPRWVYISSWFN